MLLATTMVMGCLTGCQSSSNDTSTKNDTNEVSDTAADTADSAVLPARIRRAPAAAGEEFFHNLGSEGFGSALRSAHGERYCKAF